MTLRSGAATLIVLAATAALACSGRLKVGDKTPNQGTSGEGGAGSDAVGGSHSNGASSGASHGASAGMGGGSGEASAAGGSLGLSGSGGTGATGGAGAAAGAGGAGGAGGTGGTASGGTAPSTGGTAPAAGSGNSNGASGAGGLPDWLDDVPPQEPVDGSDDDCPIGPLPPDGDCAELGQLCGYQWEGSTYQECQCRRTSGGGQRWSCDAFNGDLTHCPTTAPEHDSDCYGFFGLVCPYPPSRECGCNSSTEVWDCPAPVEPERPDPPEDLDPERSITEMSDEERQQWCDWYSALAAGPGHPPVADVVVDESGYALAGCKFDVEGCQAALAIVSRAQCIANLEQSECGAPLSLLTKCTGDMFSGGCGRADQECIEFFDTPQCSGTIVTLTFSPSASACPLKVE